MACFSLGGVAIPASPFGTETGRFLLDDLGCTGDESSITECSHPGLGSDNCKSRMHEQAAVICGTTRGMYILTEILTYLFNVLCSIPIISP